MVSLVARILAAVIGCYGLASAWSMALALAWPQLGLGARAEGTMIGLVFAFAIGVGVVIWCFAVVSLRRMLAGLLLAALLLCLPIFRFLP
ncbi:hypothetical protein [Ferrovibrio sp.]|uniref:hypothetical protein n=1 Tax=Ferrovibrio sp. TaxID=1917215 RepID=UPI0025C48FCB|nr:hypothetical protein [Ferrovibrio sp.]MBX3455021.1 hypothetical protein [Ferrovibrio sp.]